MPERGKALDLLKKYNQSQSIVQHALSAEAVMRHMAEIKKRRSGKMEKILYASDDLTGLIYATCLMRPSKAFLILL